MLLHAARRAGLSIVTLGLLSTSAFAQAPVGTPTFTVFVAAPLRDGFADVSKDTADTMKDIANRLKDDKGLTLVNRKEDADVIIVVIGRGVGSQAYGARTDIYRNYYGGASIQTLPIVGNTRWITTMLIVGDYKREFPAARTNTSQFSLGDWGEDANIIVKNIRAWVATNAETLQNRRGKIALAGPAFAGPQPGAAGACPTAPVPFAKVIAPAFAADYATCTVTTSVQFVAAGQTQGYVFGAIQKDVIDGKIAFRVLPPGEPELPEGPATGVLPHVFMTKAGSDLVFELKRGDMVLLTGHPVVGTMKQPDGQDIVQVVFVADSVRKAGG